MGILMANDSMTLCDGQVKMCVVACGWLGVVSM